MFRFGVHPVALLIVRRVLDRKICLFLYKLPNDETSEVDERTKGSRPIRNGVPMVKNLKDVSMGAFTDSMTHFASNVSYWKTMSTFDRADPRP